MSFLTHFFDSYNTEKRHTDDHYEGQNLSLIYFQDKAINIHIFNHLEIALD